MFSHVMFPKVGFLFELPFSHLQKFYERIHLIHWDKAQRQFVKWASVSSSQCRHFPGQLRRENKTQTRGKKGVGFIRQE